MVELLDCSEKLLFTSIMLKTCPILAWKPQFFSSKLKGNIIMVVLGTGLTFEPWVAVLRNALWDKQQFQFSAFYSLVGEPV